MTFQDLNKIALTKPVLSDDEMKDDITSQDIDSMTESAWAKCIQLLESDSKLKKSTIMISPEKK